jgi:glutamyl-Q tRNA(Asp) synthetase
LLPSTFWQRSLQRALGLPEPRYAHLPLVCEPDGSKLSKSRRRIGAPAAPGSGEALLWRVLALLRQDPPAELAGAPPAELWRWGIAHWQADRLRGVASLPADC